MAVRWTNVYCPHCEKMAERNHGHPLYLWGSPFKVCGRCLKPYVDTRYKELALRPLEWYIQHQPPRILGFFSGLLWLIGTFSSLISGAALLISIDGPDYDDMLRKYAIAFMISVAVYFLHQKLDRWINSRYIEAWDMKYLMKMHKESEDRLKDDKYFNRLLALGIPSISFYEEVKK